jgi:adenylate kinase family enzyme
VNQDEGFVHISVGHLNLHSRGVYSGEAMSYLSNSGPIEWPCQELSRVIVIGSSGAGKTTFAHTLADTLGVAHIELDAIHWLPNWMPRNREEFRELVRQAVSGERWLVDGNYSAVRDIVWPRATAAVWLNYSFPLVFSRVFRRTVLRVVRREELFAANRESFRQALLSRESLLWWVITTYSRRRRTYRTLFDEGIFPNMSLLEFRKPAQAECFLESLRETPSHPSHIDERP